MVDHLTLTQEAAGSRPAPGTMPVKDILKVAYWLEGHGLRIVPVEPTPRMLKAAARWNSIKSEDWVSSKEKHRQRFRLMCREFLNEMEDSE